MTGITSPPPHAPQLPMITSPTLWLIFINVGVAVLMALQGIDPVSPTPRELIDWGGNLSAYTLTGDWQRLLYSMFLHGGALHLALNMFLLFQIGRVSEAAWGRLRFLMIYLVTGLFGGFASAWWNANQAVEALNGLPPQLAFMVLAPNMVVSIGASGALLGAAGALLVHTFRAGQDAKVDLNIILQVVLLNIGMGFLINGTDNAAHVGGALSGIVIGACLLQPREGMSRFGLRLQAAGVFALMLLVLGGLMRHAVPDNLGPVAAAFRKAEAAAERRAALKREHANDKAGLRRP